MSNRAGWGSVGTSADFLRTRDTITGMSREIKDLLDIFAEYAAAKAADEPTFDIENRAERAFAKAVGEAKI